MGKNKSPFELRFRRRRRCSVLNFLHVFERDSRAALFPLFFFESRRLRGKVDVLKSKEPVFWLSEAL